MDQKDKKYEYYAFISYKREDEKWAKWLQKILESYGFPVSLRKDNPNLPQKIRPIFRDKSELSGGNLKEEIEKGLRGSKYLIVICSPRSAKSPWVSKEVQFFIDNGRENDIIPFIIGGIPNSPVTEEECFPEGLRKLSGEKEILGININEMGRDAAVVKVIARMFGLRFDTLWQRHQRANRLKLLAWGIFAALIVISSITVAYFFRQKNDQLKAERDRANEQTVIAQRARDSISVVNKSLEIAYRNIQNQKLIIDQNNADLKETNYSLAIERDKVVKANWGIMENRARLVAEKAMQLIEAGNAYQAQKICLESLPANLGVTDRPYVPELELALRRAARRTTVVIDSRITPIGFSSDGEHFLTYKESPFGVMFSFWDTYFGKVVKDVTPNNKLQTDLFKNFWSAYNPKMNIFAIQGPSYLLGGRNGILLYNFNSCRTDTLLGIGGLVNMYGEKYFRFSNDGRKFASVTKIGKDVKLWDIESGKCIGTIDKPEGFDRITFDSSGDCLVAWNQGNKTGKVIVFDIATKGITDSLVTPVKEISNIKFSPDNRIMVLLSKNEDNSRICFWKSRQSSLPVKMSGIINDVAFNGEGLIACGSNSGKIKIWNYLDFGREEILFNIGSPINKLMFAGENELVVSSNDKSIKRLRLRQLNDYSPLYTIDSVSCMAYHRTLVATYSKHDGTILIEDFSKKINPVKIKIEEESNFSDFSFSPDGKELLALTNEGEVYKWNVNSGKRQRGGIVSKGFLSKKDLSPDGRFLADGKDRQIRILDRGVECVNTLIGHTGSVYDKAFSPYGSILATASADKDVRIWDVKTGKCLSVLSGHKAPVSSVAFSDDGKLLASGDTGGTLMIWDMDLYKCIDIQGKAPYRVYSRNSSNQIWGNDMEHGFWIKDIRFSDDNKRIYSIGYSLGWPGEEADNTFAVLEWKLEPLQTIINRARATVNSNEVPTEQKRLF